MKPVDQIRIDDFLVSVEEQETGKQIDLVRLGRAVVVASFLAGDEVLWQERMDVPLNYTREQIVELLRNAAHRYNTSLKKVEALTQQLVGLTIAVAER